MVASPALATGAGGSSCGCIRVVVAKPLSWFWSLSGACWSDWRLLPSRSLCSWARCIGRRSTVRLVRSQRVAPREYDGWGCAPVMTGDVHGRSGSKQSEAVGSKNRPGKYEESASLHSCMKPLQMCAPATFFEDSPLGRGERSMASGTEVTGSWCSRTSLGDHADHLLDSPAPSLVCIRWSCRWSGSRWALRLSSLCTVEHRARGPACRLGLRLCVLKADARLDQPAN